MLLAICLEAGNQSLVLELVEGGSLFDAVHARKRFRGVSVSRRQLRHALADAARGMTYLHAMQPPLLHRDLKPGNVLVDARLRRAKLCDMGLSRVKEATARMSTVGTPHYSAPEVLRGDAYSLSADVFSFGVTMWECETRTVPHSEMEPIQVAVHVAWKGLELPVPPGLPTSELIAQCLSQDAAERPPFHRIIQQLQVDDFELE